MKVTQHHEGNVGPKFDDFGPLGRPAQHVAKHTPMRKPMIRHMGFRMGVCFATRVVAHIQVSSHAISPVCLVFLCVGCLCALGVCCVCGVCGVCVCVVCVVFVCCVCAVFVVWFVCAVCSKCNCPKAGRVPSQPSKRSHSKTAEKLIVVHPARKKSCGSFRVLQCSSRPGF